MVSDWGKPEQAPHWSNGIPAMFIGVSLSELHTCQKASPPQSMYVCMYVCISLCQAVPLMWAVHYLSHMHGSRYNAQGLKLVLSFSFFSDKESCRFSFLAILDT